MLYITTHQFLKFHLCATNTRGQVMVAPVCDKATHFKLLYLRLAGLDHRQWFSGIHSTFLVKWEGGL